MTARQIAQSGLEQLQDAIYKHLVEHGPKQPHEVADELGLRRPNDRESNSASIPHTVMVVMLNQGLLNRDPVRHGCYSARAKVTA
jgi:hypothetical protein